MPSAFLNTRYGRRLSANDIATARPPSALPPACTTPSSGRINNIPAYRETAYRRLSGAVSERGFAPPRRESVHRYIDRQLPPLPTPPVPPPRAPGHSYSPRKMPPRSSREAEAEAARRTARGFEERRRREERREREEEERLSRRREESRLRAQARSHAHAHAQAQNVDIPRRGHGSGSGRSDRHSRHAHRDQDQQQQQQYSSSAPPKSIEHRSSGYKNFGLGCLRMPFADDGCLEGVRIQETKRHKPQIVTPRPPRPASRVASPCHMRDERW